MDLNTQLTRTEVDAEDLLCGAETIRANNGNSCFLNQHRITPATYLEWSRRGFSDADDYGLANCITYAKRAACCRIDRLIRNYHLLRFYRDPFPAKIEALEKVGISIPSVIQDLIINPRNELEHGYVPADANIARHALGIATLFLAATDIAESQETIIALNMNILYSYRSIAGQIQVTFNGWSGGPMLFIDVFDEPHAAKIVDSDKGEVLYTVLSDFSRQQAVQLARILHSHYSLPSHGSPIVGTFFYTEIKRQAGF